MHIPDGYLAPAVSLGLGGAAVPAWAIATRRVRAVLDNRTVPLLAVFSAFAFTIMMFNIPVPGGTTAHGVGGTLIAIVLGPWAAVIGVSTALIIQALFFGDGGVLAIFANCFNMAVLLPLVGYATYRLVAGRSPLLSTRRVWAAGIGAYVGITASALAVGIELGIEPMLFSQNGHALYSPYGLAEAVPAMLLAHVAGASIVEALITALGVAYLQERHPEYLTLIGSRRDAGTASVRLGVGEAPLAVEPRPDTRARLRPRTLLLVGVASVAVFAVAGLATGGGDPARMFGADWSAVDWPSVAGMLAVVGVIAAVLLPAVWLIAPRRYRAAAMLLVGGAVLAPLGLIAPGFAYGEGSAANVGAAFGYVPEGLRQLSSLFGAPLAGYEFPVPFIDKARAPLVHAAIGYEIAGIIGIALLGGVMLLVGRLLARPDEPARIDADAARPDAPDGGTARERIREAARRRAIVPAGGGRRLPWRRHDREAGHVGWVEHTLAGITASIERAVFTEEHARRDGWLQRIDPRAKLLMFLVVVLAASLTTSLLLLVALYALVLLAARASRIPADFFVRRVWLGIPLFAGIVVIPAMFFVPGPRAFDLALGPLHVAPSVPGLEGAVVFVARVGVSVSLAVLLVMSTRWADVLRSLRTLHVPQVFVLILSMTYRYIFLFLHTTNGMFQARKSRVVARTTGGEQRTWIVASMGSLMSRSFRMSNDVYAAMMARGFSGELRSGRARRLRFADMAAVAGALVVATAAVAAGGYVR